ncbi:MAG: hypothetical protein ACJ74Q_15510 [Pyrinomonadaceae bacterium]
MPAALLAEETDAEDAVAQVRALVSSPWFPAIIDPRFFDFIEAEGRVPRLGDPTDPADYRGHILFQVWLLSGSEGIHDRWLFYFQWLAGGCVPDRPIPPLTFTVPQQAKDGTLARLRKLVEKLGRDHGYGERALLILIEWLAFGLGVCDTRPDLSAKTSKFLYENFDVSAVLTWPYDYLGHLLEEERGRSKRFQGFFLTHDRVCEFMTALAFDGLAGDTRLLRVHEPAAGSSRQLLHASNYALNLTAADIDPACAAVSLINAALFAPWLAFPAPAPFVRTIEAPEQIERVEQPPASATAGRVVETSGGAQALACKQSLLFDL